MDRVRLVFWFLVVFPVHQEASLTFHSIPCVSSFIHNRWYHPSTYLLILLALTISLPKSSISSDLEIERPICM